MPSFYQNSFTKSNPRRAEFARQMVLDQFGYRHGRALDQGDFTDREPHQRPLRAYEIGARR